MFDAIYIANYFVNLGILKDAPVTHMKLQKMLYFANGLHLALTDNPLLKEEVEAWQYGPVVSSVYQRFKEWGSRPITSPQPSGNIEPDKQTLDVLGAVWDITKDIDPIKLANWTHLENSPWYTAFKKAGCTTNCNAPIDNELTKKYFTETFGVHAGAETMS
ncbi:Panacea domain-containing protein [Spirosoma fluviale]|uniref:Uncharacterized phage-associated protein n=1 Tax=Spirosoma fluviale TaxID=1597977 RepID=A0A286GNJ6_9BACT|nr:type II toxin-antitoxin system antitoxin SocA domain-containing protein [Spirosoma fluviale]SOD97113.1 Uncharacterized phage-associated protein [Spirosoma fluviale]